MGEKGENYTQVGTAKQNLQKKKIEGTPEWVRLNKI